MTMSSVSLFSHTPLSFFFVCVSACNTWLMETIAAVMLDLLFRTSPVHSERGGEGEEEESSVV